MIDFLIKVAIVAVALVAAVEFVPHVRVELEPVRLVGVAVLVGVVNTAIRPIIALLTLPITILTLGLFSIVTNVVLLLFVAWLSNELGLLFAFDQWPTGALTLDGIVAALLTSVVISIVSTLLGMVRRIL